MPEIDKVNKGSAEDIKSKAANLMQKNVQDLDQAIKNFATAEKPEEVSENLNFQSMSNKIVQKIDFKLPTFRQLKDAEGHYPDFYSSALQILAQAADLEVGVQWTIDQENNTLIRDTRNASHPLQDSKYSQQSRLLNAARAADRMIRMDSGGGKIMSDTDIDNMNFVVPKNSGNYKMKLLDNDSAQEIRNKKHSKIQAIKDELEKILKNLSAMSEEEFNGFLIGILKEDSFVVNRMQQDLEHDSLGDNKTLLKQLNITKDLAGLEDKKYNICTIFNQTDDEDNTKIAFISEAMIPPLEDDYNIEALKDTVLIANSNKELFNGYMATAYWGALAAQETIPTQNLKTLPGLRNAYVQRIGEISRNPEIGGEAVLKILGKTIHSGTPSSGLKGQDKSNLIANMNVKHLSAMNKALSRKDAKLTITSLNTPYFKPDDRRAINQLTAGVKGVEDVERAVTSMNGSRAFVDSKLKPYDNTLKELGKALKEKALQEIHATVNSKQITAYQKVGQYLTSGWLTSDKNAMAAVEALEVGDLKKTLKLAIETKKSIKKSLYTYFTKALGLDFGGSNNPFFNNVLKKIAFMAVPIAFLLRLPALLSSSNASQERTVNMMSLTALINDQKILDLPNVSGENIQGSDNNYRMPDIASSCKSGKDRTGGLLIVFVKRLLGFNFGDKNQKGNIDAQIKSGHIQGMAGWMGGGTPGANGLKKHCGLTGKEFKPHMNNISLKSAKNNKIKGYIKYKEKIDLKPGIIQKQKIGLSAEERRQGVDESYEQIASEIHKDKDGVRTRNLNFDLQQNSGDNQSNGKSTKRKYGFANQVNDQQKRIISTQKELRKLTQTLQDGQVVTTRINKSLVKRIKSSGPFSCFY